MEITLGGSLSPNLDNYARRGNVDQNSDYASVDRSVVERDVERARPENRDRATELVPGESKEDTIELSSAARQMLGSTGDAEAQSADKATIASNAKKAEETVADKQGQNTEATDKANGTNEDSLELSDEAKQMLESLKNRDHEVRAHEAAHLSAAAGIAMGGAQFAMQRGPDGNMYAVGGEVSIDASAVPNNPEATVAKARQIVAAAMAPQDPSPQDRSVAAQARQMESSAATELARTRTNSQTQQTNRSQPEQQDDDQKESLNQQQTQGFSGQGQQAVNAYRMASSLHETIDPIARAYQTVA